MTENHVPPTQDDDEAAPPRYDVAAVSRVANRVKIKDVELIGTHYERVDDGIQPRALPADVEPNFGINVEWGLIEDKTRLTCVLTFGTVFEDEVEPYTIVGRFRLSYSIDDATDLEPSDFDQFAHWNAMFNAWPYWREFVSSIINRGRLPRFIVPVMGVPFGPSPQTAPT